MKEFDFTPRTRVVFGPGSLSQLGKFAGQLNFRRAMIVADSGMVKAGYVHRAAQLLQAGKIEVDFFHDFDANPDTAMAELGRASAEIAKIDSFVALGGGSSLDCAKAINFLYTNGGSVHDYHGYAKAKKPLLPMIGIPTTTGTGSEAQSYALISDADTHIKMACGDPSAAFRIALLDPELALSQPRAVRAVTGYDAISHAVESFVTKKRNPMSQCFSREAWRLLNGSYERCLSDPDDVGAIGNMQLGAFFAGLAIENSMLGATHACANPLTATYGTPHGEAIGLMLSHVVEWNTEAVADLYREFAPNLSQRLAHLADIGGLPRTLRSAGAEEVALPALAAAASEQWTGRFNPRPFDAEGALYLYRQAL